MMENILLIIISFGLTTVVGGLLGYFFQKRSWNHQNKVKLDEIEREKATKVFEEISCLMDKRLYRARQIYWKYLGEKSKDIIQEMWNSYIEVLYDWNDNLNRYCALIQRYFGKERRDFFENKIMRYLRQLGFLLEQYKRRKDENPGYHSDEKLNEIFKQLEMAHNSVYGFDIDMIIFIKKIGKS